MRLRIQTIGLLALAACGGDGDHSIGSDPAGSLAAPLSGGSADGSAAPASSPADCFANTGDPQCGTFTDPGTGASIACGSCPSGMQCGGTTVVNYATGSAAGPYQPYCSPSAGPDCPSNHWCLPACTSAQIGQTIPTGFPWGVALVCP
jgi:hypothetical protein